MSKLCWTNSWPGNEDNEVDKVDKANEAGKGRGEEINEAGKGDEDIVPPSTKFCQISACFSGSSAWAESTASGAQAILGISFLS